VSISAIRHQENGQIFTQTEDILQCAKDFYQKLFDSEPIDHRSLQIMLDELDGCPKLDAKDCEKLNAPISLFELTDTIERSPKGRSPGLDGLPFEVYPLLMKHKFTRDLLQDVMIDAMKGIFPESWTKTKLILLYKKGEATNLANWRPLSMINSDAKIFTKIMSRRLATFLPKLINPYQTGFVPGRLIANNGRALQALMAHVRKTGPNGSNVGVLIDQEKAYDRVHPVYLQNVLS
jgi:hypothetical protein